MLSGGRVSYSTIMPPYLPRSMRHKMLQVFPQLAGCVFRLSPGVVSSRSLSSERPMSAGSRRTSIYAQGYHRNRRCALRDCRQHHRRSDRRASRTHRSFRQATAHAVPRRPGIAHAAPCRCHAVVSAEGPFVIRCLTSACPSRQLELQELDTENGGRVCSRAQGVSTPPAFSKGRRSLI